MLKRTLIRRRLMAMLCSEDIPQTCNCEKGPLFDNCNEDFPFEVLDSSTHQIQENVSNQYSSDFGDDEDSPGNYYESCALIVFRVPSMRYTFCATGQDDVSVTFQIDIIAYENSGEKRQEILDEIEEKIYYRMMTRARITDAQTQQVLTPIFKMAKKNTLTVSTTDETDFLGNYTVRTLSFAFNTNGCIKPPLCETKPLCFEFSKLTVLEKDRPTVTVENEEEE